jgi:AraC family transcriptional regulator
MDSHAERSIQRAIDHVYQNVGEQITIDDMARTAMFSKFHFTRLFQRATGVSPGRFLSAVRLQQAKKLLLSTSLSVAEISNQVGYSSVGTFSSRFKSSVGLSPTAYRELRGLTPWIAIDNRRRGARTAIIEGSVIPPSESYEQRPVFLGLFPDTIPQGSPARCTVLERPGPFRFENAPEGDWYLLAQSVMPGEEDIIGDEPPIVAAHGPITVRPGLITRPQEVQLRQMRVVDPPVLLALLDARRVALNKLKEAAEAVG